ncbi:MAG: hypothetical protein CMJ18_02780 [Phycisphaeraceae bacterium]|nr:hypothetical protein [Phycisphaeraceae bacterium]
MNDRIPDHREAPFPPGTGGWSVVTLAIGAATLVCLAWPFQFTARAGPWLAVTHPTGVEIAVMVALFIPIGVAEGFLGSRILPRHGWVVLLVAVDVGVLALIGETMQLWIPARTSSIVDVVCAMIGGTIGGLLFPPRKPPSPSEITDNE